MKKYIIRDNLGNKKTIYARNLTHALSLTDNKVKDDNVVYSSSKTGIEVVYKDGWYRLKKAGKYSDWKGDKKNAIFFADRPHAIGQFNWVNDSVKDEANLATTIQALVNDEEAAVKAYEVAIKNLEGKIDGTQMQVLINIMKDERKHIENLYAVLNGQVTEKNLEDSRVRDGRHTDKFARILRGKGINFTITPNGEIKFNNRNDFKRALDLAEDYSFEFGGYDYDERDMIIEMAETI